MNCLKKLDNDASKTRQLSPELAMMPRAPFDCARESGEQRCSVGANQQRKRVRRARYRSRKIHLLKNFNSNEAAAESFLDFDFEFLFFDERNNNNNNKQPNKHRRYHQATNERTHWRRRRRASVSSRRHRAAPRERQLRALCSLKHTHTYKQM